ncbi:KleE stable inheritance protein, partial [Escherichia coli]|nr:hypothetical protein [Escherichia coli]
MTGKIYQFPGMGSKQAPPSRPSTPAVQQQGDSKVSLFLRMLHWGHFIVWTVVVLCWPAVKWLVSVDVFIRLIVMCFQWSDPNSHAGWTFVAHFVVLVALHIF